MAKDDEQFSIPGHKDRNMFIGFVWNCPADLKLLLSALLFLFSLVALFQLSPSSVRDLSRCASFTPPSSAVERLTNTNTTSGENVRNENPEGVTLEETKSGVTKRSFKGYGSAAYNFILMSAYRGGADTFAIIGLSSKPLQLFSNPTYLCQWIPQTQTANDDNITVPGYKILPDWGYGRVYTVVVVNCTFPFPVGHDGSGGRLIVHASTSGGGDTNINVSDAIEALIEAPGNINRLEIHDPPKYEYLYCGSPLYGNLSPQRVREWISYHVNLFGEKSHFVIYNASGVHEEVMEVLGPWVEIGYVTLQDVTEEERFDGYYHNQFMIVNDCLHRYRFVTKWMFFFDVDEFIYVPNNVTIKTVTDSLSEYTQFTIEQRTMSNKLCYLDDNAGNMYRKWGIEKLVYRDMKRGIRRDRKYAIQPRNVFATGVHMSQNFKGKTTHKTEGKIAYYHYHGTISERQEPCKQLVNTTNMYLDGTPYVVDTTMREVAEAVKRFELRMIGPVLQKTHQ